MLTHAEAKMGQFMAAAEKNAKEYHPYSILTHAYHETGGFQHIIGWNNFWGIKVPKRKPWTGVVVPVSTHEVFVDNFRFARFVNSKLSDIEEIKYTERIVRIEVSIGDGKKEKRNRKERRWTVKVKDLFCDWKREDEAILFYLDLIERLYPDAFKAKADPVEFFKGLVSGTRKWATDPEYVQKLTALYEKKKGEWEKV